MIWFLVTMFSILTLLFIAIVVGVAVFYYKQYKKKNGSTDQIVEEKKKEEPKKRGWWKRLWEGSTELLGAFIPIFIPLLLLMSVIVVASFLPTSQSSIKKLQESPVKGWVYDKIISK